jgi:hypothetical protein
MFEAAPADLAEDKKPSFAQRSISAPAIAENVGDAVIPSYGTHYDVARIGTANWTSSRLNRRPGDKKSEEDGDHEQSLDSAYADLFDDADSNVKSSKSGMLSLSINDTLNMKSPIDLIQSDFPSTPSALFSNRTFPLELQTDETTSTVSSNSPPKLDTGAAEASLDAAALDTATNAFQQLYVSSDKSTATTLRPAETFYPAASATGATATTGGGTDTLGASLRNTNSNKALNNQGLPNLKPADKNTLSAAATANGHNYSALLGNNPSAIVNNGLNPLTPPISSMSASFGVATPLHGMTSLSGVPVPGTAMMPAQGQMLNGQMPQGGIQQNGQYFMQQPVYLDQNGQPMWNYRPSPNQNGQYPPEFMYQGLDGSQMGMAGMGTGDPNMQNMGMMPYGQQMGQPNMAQNMAQGGYQMPYVDQNGNAMQMNGQSMYMNGLQGQQGMNNGAPLQQVGGQRMVYNPATGQYVSQAITGMSGQRGPSGQMINGQMPNGQMINGQMPNGQMGSYMNNNNGGQMMVNGMNQQQGNNNMNPPALVPRMGMANGIGMNDGSNDPNGNGMMMPNGMNGMNGMQNGGMYSMMNPQSNNRGDENMNNNNTNRNQNNNQIEIEIGL